MPKFKKIVKRLGADFIGYSLIILGIALGWLPGPGGIPLILAGLGFLSIHNHWARKLIDVLKEQGNKVPDLVFPEVKKIQLFHDVIFVTLLVLIGLLTWLQPMAWWWVLVISLSCLALTSLLLNRSRLRKIRKKT